MFTRNGIDHSSQTKKEGSGLPACDVEGDPVYIHAWRTEQVYFDSLHFNTSQRSGQSESGKEASVKTPENQ